MGFTKFRSTDQFYWSISLLTLELEVAVHDYYYSSYRFQEYELTKLNLDRPDIFILPISIPDEIRFHYSKSSRREIRFSFSLLFAQRMFSVRRRAYIIARAADGIIWIAWRSTVCLSVAGRGGARDRNGRKVEVGRGVSIVEKASRKT